SGPGRTATVRVFDGATFLPFAGVRGSFAPFGSFAGGVFVAVGDVNGDGTADIIVGVDAGTAPSVHVYNGRTGGIFSGVMGNFQAYLGTFKGGVRVAAADLNGDGKAEVITAPGAGTIGSGQTGLVRSFDLTRRSGTTPFIIQQFTPYEASFAG